jgi:predicted proteasome-type protease
MKAIKLPDAPIPAVQRSIQDALKELDTKYSAQITFTGSELLALFIVAGKIGGAPDSSLRRVFSSSCNED